MNVLEQLKEKTTFTEFVLAKKIRENCKISGKQKAGISMSDLETAMEALAEEKGIFYSLHVNSANDLLIKKSDKFEAATAEGKKRRLASEKSMVILTNGDFNSKKAGGGTKGKGKQRTERKHINIYSDYENLDD